MANKLMLPIVAATVCTSILFGTTPALAGDVPVTDSAPVSQQAPVLPPEPVSILATAPAAITVLAATSGVVHGVVTDDTAAPVEGTPVTVVATSPGEVTRTLSTATTTGGAYQVTFGLVGGTWTITATAGVATGTASVTVGSLLAVQATQPRVASLSNATLHVTVTDAGHPVAANVSVSVKEPTDARYKLVGSANTGQEGFAEFGTHPWRNPQYKVTVQRKNATVSSTIVGKTIPTFAAVTPPKGAPEPKVRTPLVMQPSRTGEFAQISSIPDSVFSTMKGISWRQGCKPRNQLSMVEMNYRGFDGYVHRGRIIVDSSIARNTRGIFNQLYRSKYPIRQVHPPDTYGVGVPGRPGADDRKSMRADNTYGFNCRYVVGREAARVWSPHASGRAIDINTWTNPYVTSGATYPNEYYRDRGKNHPAMMKRTKAGVRAFESHGCSWGASFNDWQHFDC